MLFNADFRSVGAALSADVNHLSKPHTQPVSSVVFFFIINTCRYASVISKIPQFTSKQMNTPAAVLHRALSHALVLCFFNRLHLSVPCVSDKDKE